MRLTTIGRLCPNPYQTPYVLRQAVLDGTLRRVYAGGTPVVLTDCCSDAGNELRSPGTKEMGRNARQGIAARSLSFVLSGTKGIT